MNDLIIAARATHKGKIPLTGAINAIALNDVTLTCEPQGLDDVSDGYSWHRVDGDIPSHSSGQNSSNLTIHRILPADEGNYSCMVAQFRHCAKSNNITVIVTGKKYYVAIQVFNQITLSCYQCMYSYNH